MPVLLVQIFQIITPTSNPAHPHPHSATTTAECLALATMPSLSFVPYVPLGILLQMGNAWSTLHAVHDNTTATGHATTSARPVETTTTLLETASTARMQSDITLQMGPALSKQSNVGLVSGNQILTASMYPQPATNSTKIVEHVFPALICMNSRTAHALS